VMAGVKTSKWTEDILLGNRTVMVEGGISAGNQRPRVDINGD
jgi:hypothetical protein